MLFFRSAKSPLVDAQQPEKEDRVDKASGQTSVLAVVVARRWLRWIGVLQIVALTIATVWLTLALLSCPNPETFETRSTYSGVETLRDRLIDDLRKKTDLQTFAPEDWAVEADGKPNDYSRIRNLVEWGEEDADNPEEMQALSIKIVQGYRQRFTDYRFIIIYLTAATVTGLFCTLILVLVPKLSIAALTMGVSCSLLPPVTELVVGRDFGDTVLYSLPFIVMSLAMFCCESWAWWLEQFHRNPSSRDAWIQIWIGGVLLLGGLALAAFAIFSDSDSNYQVTQGLGAGIAAGLWCLVDGLRDFFRTRKTDSAASHPRT